MKNFYDVLTQYISENQFNFGDGDSVLTMLYEAYSECNRLYDAQIKADFNELYRLMNGIELREWIGLSIRSVSSAGITKDPDLLKA